LAMQRWALGLTPPPSQIESMVPKFQSEVSPEKPPSDLESIDETDKRLAISVEPMHTRASASSLFICAILVWAGSCVFGSSKGHFYLFGVLTIAGGMIGIFGIYHAIAAANQNFLGLTTGSSFATFVSKNSAGAFLNVGIAGTLGLVSWSMIHLRRSSTDFRYRFSDSSFAAKMRGAAQDFVADLSTSQIAIVLALVLLISAMLISLCRGAAVSGLGAFVVAVLIVIPKRPSGVGIIIGIVIAGLCLGALYGLQLDDQVYSKFESIWDVDINEELKDGRAYIWGVAWQATRYYGLVGSGLGTFHFSSLPFQNPTSPGWYYHAESLYAQCSVELGLIGITLMTIAIIGLFRRVSQIVVTDQFNAYSPIKFAGMYLLISQALHAFVDVGLIIPAVYIPASILIGAALGANRESIRESKQAHDRRKSEMSRIDNDKMQSAPIAWMACSVMAICAFVFLFTGRSAIESMAASDELQKWQNEEFSKPISDRSRKMVDEFAKRHASYSADFASNGLSMTMVSEAIVNDFRFRLLGSKPPSVELETYWRQSYPLLIQIALQQAPSDGKRREVIDLIGGDRGLATLSKATQWAAKAQARSPLDWRPLWGRMLCSVDTKPADKLRLFHVFERIAAHRSNQLLSASVMFGNTMTEDETNLIWRNAIRANANVSLDAGRLIATLRDDKSIPMEIFPARPLVLSDLASTVFVKAKFPLTNRKIWLWAVDLAVKSPMSTSKRSLWLADAFRELDDLPAEVENLKIASRFQPGDLRIQCRLANRLLDLGDESGARDVYRQLLRIDPNDGLVKALAQRLTPK
jgi:hypothetical protein